MYLGVVRELSGRASAAKVEGPGFNPRPRQHFSIDLWLVSPRFRVQFPGHRYICAKLEDFALSTVEEWLAIQCDYSW